jgi:hypothetical protein
MRQPARITQEEVEENGGGNDENEIVMQGEYLLL